MAFVKVWVVVVKCGPFMCLKGEVWMCSHRLLPQDYLDVLELGALYWEIPLDWVRKMPSLFPSA